jgi:radical SAM-linked protein
MLRLFGRASVRASLPVCHSQGFNPHPQITLPLPRPVGMASAAERVVMDLLERREAGDVLQSLQVQMPKGISLYRAEYLPTPQRCRPAKVCYRVEIPEFNRSEVESLASTLLGPSPFPVERKRFKTGRMTTVDLQPFVESIQVDDSGLVMKLLLQHDGSTARPADVLAGLGLRADDVQHRIRRLEIEWQ